jgi:hypothetical protein
MSVISLISKIEAMGYELALTADGVCFAGEGPMAAPHLITELRRNKQAIHDALRMRNDRPYIAAELDRRLTDRYSEIFESGKSGTEITIIRLQIEADVIAELARGIRHDHAPKPSHVAYKALKPVDLSDCDRAARAAGMVPDLFGDEPHKPASIAVDCPIKFKPMSDAARADAIATLSAAELLASLQARGLTFKLTEDRASFVTQRSRLLAGETEALSRHRAAITKTLRDLSDIADMIEPVRDGHAD